MKRLLVTLAAVVVVGVCLSTVAVNADVDADVDVQNTTNKTTTAATTSTTSATTTKTIPTKPTTTTPAKDVPKYTVEQNGTVCMAVQAKITVSLTLKNKTAMSYTVPYSVEVSGTCGTDSDTMTLAWSNQIINPNITLKLDVSKSGKSYKLSGVMLQYDFGEDNSTYLSKKVSKFETTTGTGYKCLKTNKISLRNGTINATVILDQLRMEAFMTTQNGTFSNTVTDCESRSKANTIVPIVVGAALAAMVIIVLVGYCIGRRRTRPGYQQMNA